MLIVAAALFALAALGGLAMAFIHFRKDRNPPGALAAVHGAAAAAALLILLWAVVQAGGGAAVSWALGLLAVAALGGFFLVSFHLRGRRLPSAGVVVHALAAVAGFVLLLLAIAGA
ncbi:MAG TPA: hypothetical protein VFV84_03275 [Burkholderiales bacterium]|nr:hypothetical protein [Burkholderiales bacterium]